MPANEFQRAQAAWAAARRMIARDERPCYRVAAIGDGTFHVVELPWIAPIAATPGTALAVARDAIARWLDIEPDAVDIERG